MSKHSSSGREWQKIRAAILERDENICGYCGGTATQVDHIISKAHSGTDDMHNLVAACAVCNRNKSDKVLLRTQWVSPKYLELTSIISSATHQRGMR